MIIGTAPQSPEDFQTRLVEITDNLPKRLRQCAYFIAQNTDRIAISTIAELSQLAQVQPSAFMRFCQFMGYSGYSQMQRMFRNNHSQHWPDYATRLDKLRKNGAETPSALLAEFIDAGRSSLENLANTVDHASLEKAVSIIAKARVIHIVGLNRAYPVATYLSYAFDKMNVPAMRHDNSGNLDHRHAIQSEDVVIAITFAPYTQKTLKIAEFAKSKNTEIVAITDALNSPMHRFSKTILTVTEAEVGAFRALSAPLSLAIALGVAVGARRETETNSMPHAK